MTDTDISLLDIIGKYKRLEKQIQELKAENEALKEQSQNVDNENDWRELILYRPSKKQTPTEVTWTEDDDPDKQKWYRENGYRRDVIGLVKKKKI